MSKSLSGSKGVPIKLQECLPECLLECLPECLPECLADYLPKRLPDYLPELLSNSVEDYRYEDEFEKDDYWYEDDLEKIMITVMKLPEFLNKARPKINIYGKNPVIVILAVLFCVFSCHAIPIYFCCYFIGTQQVRDLG